MNIKKAELRFKREWANAAKKLKRELPQVETVAPAIDADIVVSFTGFPEADALDYTGCKCTTIMNNAAALIVPPEWVSAPTRHLFAETPADFLHNALLGAGITDWLGIRVTDDGAALEVEFLDHPTTEQIAALKAHYDVLTFDELVYTFVERTSTPLVSPLTVETRLRAAWGGARAGKIQSIEATDNPRRWLVTTAKSIPANANFLDHGLEQIELWAAERRALVEITPPLWSKILASAAPPPATTDTTEAAIVADTDTQPIPTPEATPPPELDDRDLELNALKAQVDSLQDIIRALTPIANEWQTLRLTIKREGSNITAHPEIAEQERQGWRVHHIQYAPNGEDRLFVLMERRGQAEPKPRYLSASSRVHGVRDLEWSPIINTNGMGSGLAESMIRSMNDELADSATGLWNAFQRMGVTPRGN